MEKSQSSQPKIENHNASPINELFRKFSHKTAEASGTARAFIIAVSVIIAWILTGPLFNYSDTWQLIINTSTTIVTFLMVFLIQNTQNRDSKAIHLKLDEIIISIKKARNQFLDVEDKSDEELDQLRRGFEKLVTEKTPPPKNIPS